MGPIPRSRPVTAGRHRLGRGVATSVSEWKRFHSLTLVATRKQKRFEIGCHRSGLIKCPGDIYFAIRTVIWEAPGTGLSEATMRYPPPQPENIAPAYCR